MKKVEQIKEQTTNVQQTANVTALEQRQATATTVIVEKADTMVTVPGAQTSINAMFSDLLNGVTVTNDDFTVTAKADDKGNVTVTAESKPKEVPVFIDRVTTKNEAVETYRVEDAEVTTDVTTKDLERNTEIERKRSWWWVPFVAFPLLLLLLLIVLRRYIPLPW